MGLIRPIVGLATGVRTRARTLLAVGVGAILLLAPPAGAGRTTLRSSLRSELNQYLSTQRLPEHISAVGLGITFRGSRAPINLAVGRTRYVGGRPISPYALWQIGSNTKAFTTVMLLQLEAEHKLSINDRLGRWLPQYRAWRRITIKQLLNMTAGIQDYNIQPAFLSAYAAAPNRVFSAPQLVSYAVGLPLKPGWEYSNTNYVLAQMIIARVTHDSYGDQLQRRIVRPLGLHNLFFSATRYPRKVLDRLPAGYYFGAIPLPQMASQVGKDQSRHTASTNQGSGGIVSSLQDMARWDRALYAGRELAPKQQRELKSLVSQKTGDPISRTTPSDPQGFGLGIIQGHLPGIGTVWFYEGQTLGYRALHWYFPRSGTIITLGVNSATLESNLGRLAASVYQTLHRARLA